MSKSRCQSAAVARSRRLKTLVFLELSFSMNDLRRPNSANSFQGPDNPKALIGRSHSSLIPAVTAQCLSATPNRFRRQNRSFQVIIGAWPWPWSSVSNGQSKTAREGQIENQPLEGDAHGRKMPQGAREHSK